MAMQQDWRAFEREHIWHPYSSLGNPADLYAVTSAQGCRLMLDDGTEVIDGMASWWCMIHGYNHPRLNDAIERQLHEMAHVMFGGLTHQPAVELAQRLLDLTPEPLQKVFFADSGSVSVEVAMKMALQYWQGRGKRRKQRLLTIRNGYHGDTFGAMSVCDPEGGMHHLFSGILPQQLFAPAPESRPSEPWDSSDIAVFAQLIEQHADELAAVILEPVVQGAGGMRFYHPQYLREVRELCDRFGLLLIVDEIATGFGRTGKLFACEHAEVTADILCVGKALTGGYLSLAATLVSDEVAQGICANEQVFMHGPTFMANPLACAVANASIELLLESPWQQRVNAIHHHFEAHLKPLSNNEHVADVRSFGAIGVVEMKQPLDIARLQRELIAQGVWLRPFGKLLYAMPPYTIEQEELQQLTDAICHVVEGCISD
ncbi:MAG: adenosylmethionine--8-amino-7-oxononanoate transaminase [Pseudomonadota bacterium]|nr:adenosylmethionine--8-amino-7-oxononanoate transaminase [Pseudomonadota bacterium]